MIAVVVPVKALSASKSRLRPHLGDACAHRLTLAMLGDVLEALAKVPGLGPIGVVTPDATVAEAARAVGAVALLRDDPGLNPAVEAAAAELAPGPEDGVLVVLGDVAGVRPGDVTLLLENAPEPGVALAPSTDGGTAALLRVPRRVIPAGFGPGSAKVHRSLAERAGVDYRELALPSLAFDLDEPEDLEAFLASDAAGPRTRALLRKIAAPGPR
jgi:2-phospho-L-lactate guanylyltransferase